MEAVAKHAINPESPFRDQAIDELGYATKLYAAAKQLRRLLSDSDVNVRVRAYKALRRRFDPALDSKLLYQDNLILGVVDCTGPYVIYIQRTMKPRIAVFGSQMRVRPPAMFPGERRDKRRVLSQISDNQDGESLTVIFLNKRTGMHSPPLPAPLSVAGLIEFLGSEPLVGENGDPSGLGAPYSEICDIISCFCDARSIPATLVVEDLRGREDYGEESMRERRETEY
jgi:hypothetical protein